MIKDYSETLNHCSTFIKQTEIRLRAKGYCLPYTMDLPQDIGNVPCKLAYDREGEGSKNMRLIFFDGENWKPLISTTASIRLSCLKHIAPLINLMNENMDELVGPHLAELKTMTIEDQEMEEVPPEIKHDLEIEEIEG